MDPVEQTALHPREALYVSGRDLPALPVCEHIAGNERMIRKALALQETMAGAFDLTCDCEDGAAVGAEQDHAWMVARVLREQGTAAGRVGLRVHDLLHPALPAELEIILGEVGDQIAYITLPKVEGLDDVLRMRERIERRVARAQLNLPRLHVLIETHGALAQVAQIAAVPGVETLDFGLLDFVSAHHGALNAEAMRSPLQFEHPLLVRAKTELVAAALAQGVVPAHNVCLALRDPEQVAQDARRARHQFGFLRMWSIHPMQIQPILDAMRPAEEAVQTAGRVLLAAQAAGWAPIDDGGELHDRASYRYSWAVLQRAHAARMALDPAVQAAFF